MKKQLVKLFSFVLLGSALVLASCSKDDDHHYDMGSQDFVNQAASANMFEIAAGTLALQKSTNADVKAYGNHMVTDHGKAATEMADLVSKKGLTMPTAMLAKEQNNYNTLSGLSGAAFDKQFAAMMVTSHQQTIDLFQHASGDTGVADIDLRAFASGKLPTLTEHLKDAQNLQTKVGQ